jgi:hypothetical protein
MLLVKIFGLWILAVTAFAGWQRLTNGKETKPSRAVAPPNSGGH